VVSDWNPEITGAMCAGALEVLEAAGIPESSILVRRVPGAFETPLAARWMLGAGGCDGVICIASIIRGETAHFDFVSSATAHGVQDVSLKTGKPAIFCVLTDDNIEQSRARAGGAHGNKGVEAAVACVQMMKLGESLSSGGHLSGWGVGM
jgi:6,7-dimethyl-8-ribityllumazine synthase